MSKPARFVIIGADAAGMSAASEARRVDPDLEIIAYDRGGFASYSQCGLPALIADTLAATGLAPQCLQLEITESMLLDAVETTRTTLDAVHALGVRVALDDFGMGYSSLRYLQHLPLDTLKIAQPFVADIVTDAQAAAISTGVSALGNSLGLTVIAEGVETADQGRVLRAQQCDAIQGYLVSHPLPAAAVLAYLQDHDHAASVPVSAACAATARQPHTDGA